MKILVLNAGSSSQKSCLYDFTSTTNLEQPSTPLWEASIDWTFSSEYGLLKVEAKGYKQEIKLSANDHLVGINAMLETLVTGKTKVLEQLTDIDLVGHRVVHGGREYSQATIITAKVKQTISELSPLAPNHNPAHLQGIEAIEHILGDIKQVAVFDTAFHTSIPLYAKIYPIPYEWYDKGIQRYGFHGISHEYVSQRTAQILGQPLTEMNLLTCHLGNGCSITAIKEGKSINTSMGFTPLEGVMMGTRSGSIDPAILIYLMQEYDYDARQLNQMLNKKSGLLGISGLSADLRNILASRENGDTKAQLAFDIYIHRLRSSIGAMMASLGGLDALVFTAGVGENAAIVREKACEKFTFLGVQLDRDKNNTRPVNEDIATPDSQVRVLVIHTEEDWTIAEMTKDTASQC